MPRPLPEAGIEVLDGLPQKWETMYPDAPESEKMGDPAYRAWREAREAAQATAAERRR